MLCFHLGYDINCGCESRYMISGLKLGESWEKRPLNLAHFSLFLTKGKVLIYSTIKEIRQFLICPRFVITCNLVKI